MSTFLVDLDAPGVAVHDGYRNVSHRGYTNSIIDFDDVFVGDDALLGEEGKGFELAGEWLGSTRLQVAASCLGRAERALELSIQHAATREQFGQPIGRFQGVGFKLADMAERAAGRRADDACTPPGSMTRALPPTPTSRWPR